MIVNNKHIVKDDEQLLENTIKQSLKDSDIIIVSGGSSQGKKDVTAKVINDVASCGVLTHGLALKPGKPTITGYDEDTKTVLIGLPGHPVAAMIVFELLGVWLQNKLMNVNDKFEIIARMETNVASAPGRSTCQLVSLRKTENGYLAIPVHGKSGLMSTLIQSDGYIIINRFNEGVQKGENVYVVITSYSIHYTKLYETDCDNNKITAICKVKIDGKTGVDRITSYNVCYTKLLRALLYIFCHKASHIYWVLS